MRFLLKWVRLILVVLFDTVTDFVTFQPKFTVEARDCPFFHIAEQRPSTTLIDVDRVVTEANDHIATWIPQSVKVPPLIYSRLSRGGKTTFLLSLYNHLRTAGQHAVISISFNGGIKNYFKPGDSAKTKLLRAIASRFFKDPDANEIWDVSEDQLLTHIETTRNGLPVILLIDELNELRSPLDFETTDFLIRNFLDKRDRMLVFTTHVPMGAGELVHLMKGISARDIVILSPPRCFNLQTIQTIDRCDHVTPAEISLYGGIPSLIYAVKNLQYTPIARFNDVNYSFSPEEEAEIIPAFVDCVLTGNRHPCLSPFERFATAEADRKIRFPLIYISCICSLFAHLRDYFAVPSTSLLNTYASEVGSGKDWECIIEICILFHALQWKYWNVSGPLKIAMGEPIHERNDVDFGRFVIGAQITTPQDAQRHLFQLLHRKRPGCYLFVSQFACFSVYDGFICLKRADNSIAIFAYQAKLGNEIPAPPTEILNWIQIGFLLRGKPVETPRARGYWYQYSRENMEEFLGYSLKNLLPLHWRQDIDM